LEKLLPYIQDRLQGVVVSHLDYQKLLPKYDGKETMWFFDPPYYKTDVSGYKHKEINVEQFHNHLTHLKGKFVLLYDDDPYIRKLFKEFYIYQIKSAYQVGNPYDTKQSYELIITNFKIKI
jgi:DNA adenine methylase